jgi:hypothetical protein
MLRASPGTPMHHFLCTIYPGELIWLRDLSPDAHSKMLLHELEGFKLPYYVAIGLLLVSLSWIQGWVVLTRGAVPEGKI